MLVVYYDLIVQAPRRRRQANRWDKVYHQHQLQHKKFFSKPCKAKLAQK